MKSVLVFAFVCAFSSTTFAAVKSKAVSTSSNLPVPTEKTAYNHLEIEPDFAVAIVNPTDINNLVKDYNSFLEGNNFKGGRLGEFGSSLSVGAAVTYRILPAFGLGLGFHRMFGSAEATSTVENKSISASSSFGANLLTLEMRMIPLRYKGLEAVFAPNMGLGFYSYSSAASGSFVTLRTGNSSTAIDTSSTAFTFAANAGARYWFLENLSAGLFFGYRYAKSGVLKVDNVKNDTRTGKGADLQTQDGTKTSLDLSGINIAANITLGI